MTPDYSEVSKLADLWLHPRQGTDAALAMAMGHVILREFYFNKRSAYFDDYARRYTDLPLLVQLKEQTLPTAVRCWCRIVTCGPAISTASSARTITRTGRRLPSTRTARWSCRTARSASAGVEGRADEGRWNLEAKEGRHGNDVALKLSVLEDGVQPHEVVTVGFPYFGGIDTPHFTASKQGDVLARTVPTVRIVLGKEGEKREALVATVFDLLAANYGVDRGFGGCGRLQRRRSVHARLAGEDHRCAA